MSLNEVFFIKINEFNSFFVIYSELKTRLFRAEKIIRRHDRFKNIHIRNFKRNRHDDDDDDSRFHSHSKSNINKNKSKNKNQRERDDRTEFSHAIDEIIQIHQLLNSIVMSLIQNFKKYVKNDFNQKLLEVKKLKNLMLFNQINVLKNYINDVSLNKVDDVNNSDVNFIENSNINVVVRAFRAIRRREYRAS